MLRLTSACADRESRRFLALMRALAGGGAVDGIAGLSYRDNGRVRHTPLAPWSRSTRCPDGRTSASRWTATFISHYLGRRVGTHHSSYGCPFACSFCAVVGIAKRQVGRGIACPSRRRSWSSSSREYGADAVQFHDMDFFISESRTRAIAERIARRWA